MKLSRFPDKQPSIASDRAELATYLAAARPEMVAKMTIETLQLRFRRLPKREVECRLLATQDRIRREAVQRPI